MKDLECSHVELDDAHNRKIYERFMEKDLEWSHIDNGPKR